MFESRWLYEIVLFIYSLSLIGYFIDFIKRSSRINQIAYWLLSLVWFIQTIFLLSQFFIVKNFPILNLNDGLFFYAWILLTFSLIMNRLFSIHFIVFFTNIFSFFILLLSILLNVQKQKYDLGVQLVHEILMIHITFAIISYGFFTLSFLLALMYLLQHFLLKDKIGLKWVWRFEDLKQLDLYSYMFVIIGVPLLLIGIILGIVWAYVANAEFYWLDLKTLGSILVLIVYSIYLILRGIKGYQGKPISIFNTAAFLILLLNLFLFSLLTNFHF